MSNWRRQAFETFAPAMAYVSVETANGDPSLGSAFHVGEGVFVTARHVVDGVRIVRVATTEMYSIPAEDQSGASPGSVIYSGGRGAGQLQIVRGPYLHPDESVDVAVFVVDYKELPSIPLGDHLDDWLGTELVLSSAIVLGYPPIPTASGPVLFATAGEVNAIVDRYVCAHPHFLISSLARGGLSGGVALSEHGFALGLVTESLAKHEQPVELGYLAILTVEPIWECLAHYGLLTKEQRRQWRSGTWTSRTTMFTAPMSCHPGMSTSEGGGMVERSLAPEAAGLLITSSVPALLNAALRAATEGKVHSVRRQESHLVEIEFTAEPSDLASILGTAARAAVRVFREQGLIEAGDDQVGDQGPSFDRRR